MAYHIDYQAYDDDDHGSQDRYNHEPELIEVPDSLPQPEIDRPIPGRDFPYPDDPDEDTDVDTEISNYRGRLIVPDKPPVDPKTGQPMPYDPNTLEDFADEIGPFTLIPISELLN